MNLLDNAFAYVAPGIALRRLRNRYALNVMDEHIRKYDSAQHGRRGKEWRGVGSTSANTEIEAANNTLRDRSRDLGRNNPYARRAFNLIANNTVGAGIQPGIRPLAGKKPASVERIRQMWKTWADGTGCDVERLKTFWAIEHMVMKAVTESGECFVVFRKRKDTPGVPLQLQVLEADYLDSTRELPAENRSNGSYIMQGIQFRADGSREGYWLWNGHPGETRTMRGIMSEFIRSEDVVHVFLQERPGQIRGVPFLASVMQRLRDFDEYEDTQLVRQKIAACFVAFIEDPTDATPGARNTAGHPDLEKVEPGIIERMGPGQKITFGNPPPTENYSEYSTAILRGIAAGAGISYEGLTGDLSQVNFSSARLGWLEFQRQIEAWQWNMLIPQFCMRVWEEFIAAARVKAGDTKLDALVTWTAPRREMIDPQKETAGLIARMNGYLSSWEDVVTELGENPDDLFDRIVQDGKRFENAGLVSPVDVRLNTPPAPDDQGTAATAPAGNKKTAGTKKPS